MRELDNAPGPSPRYLRNAAPPAPGWHWRVAGESGDLAGVTLLASPSGVMLLLDVENYVFTLDPAHLLVWHQRYIDTGPTEPVVLRIFELSALQPLDGTVEQLCKSMRQAKEPFLASAPPLRELRLPTTIVGSPQQASFPPELKRIDELLILCHSSGIEEHPGWQRKLAVLSASPARGTYEIVRAGLVQFRRIRLRLPGGHSRRARPPDRTRSRRRHSDRAVRAGRQPAAATLECDAMLRHRLRAGIAGFLSALPQFRGKGRMTGLIDRQLTDYDDPLSYLAVTEINGAKLMLNLRLFGERFIFYYRHYEPAHVAMLQRLYERGNFLDIGSNIGIYTVSMAGVVRDAGGRIFSVEPVPENVERQRRNIELNGCEDIVEIANVVLGAAEGEILMSGDFDTGNVNAVVAEGGERRFPMTTLDTLATERKWTDITVLKIDVEGYEPAVLAGGARVIARDRPIILGEFNRERMKMNGFSMKETWTKLQQLGYRCSLLRDGALTELSEPGVEENLFFIAP